MKIQSDSGTGPLEQEYRRNYSLFLSTAQRILGERPLAEDAVQTAWLNFCKAGIPAALPQNKWRSYLLVAVHNAAISLLRSRKHEVADEDAFSLVQSDTASPAEQAERADAGRQLYKALQQLPAQDQSILMLKYSYGCTLKQIADITCLPQETLKKRLYRAREKLKMKWEE